MGLFDFFKKNKGDGEDAGAPSEEAAAEGAPSQGESAAADLPAAESAAAAQPAGRRRRNSVPTAVAAPVMNPVLEQELLRDPNNIDVYLVYGQWLHSRGDPRGELISIQHRLEFNPDNAEMKEANKVYMKGYQTYFLGELASYKAHLKLRWRLGFIFSARIVEAVDEDPPSVVDIISELAAHDSARILQQLKLELRQGEDYKEYGQAIDALAKAGEWITVRQLVLNRGPGELEVPAKPLELERLWARFPNLEDLGLGLSQIDLGALELPRLRSLELKADCIESRTIKSICAAKCPNLERLVLSCDHPPGTSAPQLEDMRILLQATAFPKLKHLGLLKPASGDVLCQALPESALARSLETVDLSGGNITDQGAKALVERKEQLKGIKLLCLDDNCLTEEGVAILDELPPLVTAAAQRSVPLR